jgi:hypothetical protein
MNACPRKTFQITEITCIMEIMKLEEMPVLDDFATPTSAEVLEPSGVHPRQLGLAMKQVIAALSTKGQSSSGLAYGVVIYGGKHRKTRPNYLATVSTFFRAYLRGWRALSNIPDLILTSPDQDHLQTLEAKDFGDVRFFVGRATLSDIKVKIQPSLGIYIISSHLDTSLLENLGLPLLPKAFREVPLVIQVKSSNLSTEEGESMASWSGWEEPDDLTVVVDNAEPAIPKDTLSWRREFMSENECWTSARVAEESSSRATNRAAIASRWATEKKIFSVRFEGQQWFPRFQFQDGMPIAVVSQIMTMFPEHATGWELAYFFAAPNPNLGGRKPLELLKSDPSRLLSLAQAFAHPADVF